MRIAIYCRVSTGNQTNENQLPDLREYAAQRGFEVAGEYVDSGVSGTKDSRPALNRLMTDAQQRKFDAVLVWTLDRWGRSIQHLVNSINELKAYGVEFISFRDALDLSTPSGRLQFNMLSAFAEFERDMIVERTKAGLRRAKRQGKVLGRPKCEVDVPIVRKMRAAGTPWRTIASKMGCNHSTLSSLL